MEEIFNKYQQNFPWLLIPLMRTHLSRFVKTYVSKTYKIQNLKDEISALDGQHIPHNLSKLISSFAKSSLHSKNPSRAAEELAFIKGCERSRLNEALEKAVLDRTSLENDFLSDLDTSLAQANIGFRRDLLTSESSPLATRWNDLLNALKTPIIVSFELNRVKTSRIKERKRLAFEEKKAKDNEAILLSKKQLDKIIQDGVKSALSGKGTGRRPTLQPSSRKQKGASPKTKRSGKQKGRPIKTSGKKRT